MKTKMKKFLVLLLFLSVVTPVLRSDEGDDARKITLKTDTVTVYQQNAYVERLGTVKLQKGENRFYITGLPQELIQDTLTAFRPAGTGIYAIKEFEYRSIVEKNLQGGEADLTGKLAMLQKQLKAKQDTLLVMDDKLAFLRSITAKSVDEISKMAAFKEVNVKNAEELVDFITKGIDDCLAQKRDANAAIEKINSDIQIAQSQLAGIKQGGSRTVNVLYVSVDAKDDCEASLGVKYVVTNAWWTPYYESNLDTAASNINTRMYAKVFQSTSEKWDNVRLIIATGTPAFDSTLPELAPWIIGQAQVYRASGKVMKAEVAKAPAVAEESLAEDKDALDVIQNRVESVTYSEINMQLKIKDRYDVLNNGMQKKVLVKSLDLDALKVSHTVIPSMSAKAYLTAGFKNTSDMVLLPGPVSLYLNGDYTGKAELGNEIARNEEVKFSFGTDENIKVKKEKLPSKEGETGFFGMDRRVDFAYKITLENYKDKKASITLKEALPFSAQDKIKVEVYEESIKHDSISDNNIYTWKLELKPGEKKELVYRFRVISPKDIYVNGL